MSAVSSGRGAVASSACAGRNAPERQQHLGEGERARERGPVSAECGPPRVGLIRSGDAGCFVGADGDGAAGVLGARVVVLPVAVAAALPVACPSPS